MAGGLPEGLVSNKRGATVGTEEDVSLEAVDTLKFWRIYSSGNAAIAENVGRRLENFFWRIAMSERVREHLSGAQIDKQFNNISEGGYIRTTPTPSPRSSRRLGSYDTEAGSSISTEGAVFISSASTKAGPVPGDEELADTSVTPTPQSPFERSPEATINPKEKRRTTTARPPPILKKTGSGSGPSSKTSSVFSPASQELPSTAAAGSEEAVTFDDDFTPTDPLIPRAGKSARRSTLTRFNEEVAVSIPKVSTASRSSGARLSSESSQRSGKRNPVVVASTGASKRRPPAMRQRSSQVASFGASKDAPSRSSSSPNLARNMKPTDTNIADSPSQEAEASSARRLRATSPHPSKNRKRLSPSPPSSEETAEDFGGEDTGAQEPSTNSSSTPTLVEEMANVNSDMPKPLVDPDFRSKFVDKARPSNRSFTNVSSFARKSSVAVPAAASFQASGTLDTGEGTSTAGRNKGKEAFKNEVVPLKAPAAAGPRTPAEASQPLPRTKSQLTLLLERERNRPAGQEQ